jgi:hypothetical protein
MVAPGVGAVLTGTSVFRPIFKHVFTQVRIALLKIVRFKKTFENHVGSMKVPKTRFSSS